MAAGVTACGSPPEVEPATSGSEQHVWVNGDFENDNVGTTPPTGWTVTTNLNPTITDTRPSPQTLASLNLGAGGVSMTYVVGGAAETQIDPDVGAAGTLRYPKYGSRAVRVNYASSASPGKDKNANSLKQTMTIGPGDVDPIDDKVHVRFAVAPILENPAHTYTEQPYYFIRLFNITKGITVYSDFNTSGQPGVPWKDFTDTFGFAAQYTDWQLVDVAPGNAQLAIGDQIELLVIAAGCSLGGHWGRIYVDAVGSGVPGLYAWATGPQQQNAGSNIVYTMYYKNGGTTATSGTKLDLVTPPNTTFVSTSLGGACTAPAVGGTGTVSCSLGTLAQGATGSFTVTVAIPGGTANGTLITNGNYSVYATGVSALIGPKVNTTVTNGVSYANVGITKTDGVSARVWGGSTTYTIVASNAGPLATTATVTDTMPAQLTGVTWSCAGSGGGTCGATPGTGNISQSVTLPVGGSVTYTVNANIVAGTGSGSVTNTATIAVTGGNTDPDTSNNTAVDTDSLGTLHAVTVTMSGPGTAGSVSSAPAAIDCPSGSCSASFLEGSQLVLTAQPENGGTFTGWGGACSGSSLTCTLTVDAAKSVTAAFAGAPASVSATGGATQSTAISTAFGSALQVTVRDAQSNPVPGVTVTYTAPGSGARATLSATTAVTNSSGVASVTATANATPGDYNVTAAVSGVATPATFALSNLGPPASVAVSSGSGQSTAVTTAFAPLEAIVRDAANHPLSGVTVTFTKPGTGASMTAASTAVTAANGIASLAATANTVAGSYSATASVVGVATPATFALTNTAGAPATLAVVGGQNQTPTVNTAFATALTVELTDAHGNPVAGGVILFEAPGSAPTATLSAASAVTGANGRASVTATAGTVAGSYGITATLTGLSPVTFDVTQVAGAPATATLASGDGQSATVGTAYGVPLGVLVKDAFDNPVQGVTVTFAVPGSGASASMTGGASATTTAAGIAAKAVTANTVAGAFTATGTVSGLPAVGFALTNLAGAPATVTATGGGGQSVEVTEAFAVALAVRVTDAFGNRVPGATVSFTGPASGASAACAPSPTTTSATGDASCTATANSVAGAYSVTAAVGALAPATFALTNTAGPAAAIAITGGDGQSAEVTQAFGDALAVRVADAFDNPVQGAVVGFGAPSSGASAALSAATATTAADGTASVTATANTAAGAYAVAAAVGAVTPASFALTNTAAAPATIAVSSGDEQSATVTTAFAAPLVAVVKDTHGNPVPGATVAFSAPSSGASAAVATASASTNAQGLVSTEVTANTVAGTYSVAATVGALAPASFALTNTAGAAATVAVTGGDDQSATVATAFGAPLAVVVTDAHGNPVPGATVTFTGPASGAGAVCAPAAPVTNASGAASCTATANQVAGTYAVAAATPGATPASFALTNTAGAPAVVAATGGGGQSAVVTTAFAAALAVRVADAFDNPVAGAVVAFTAPSSGASAETSAATATTAADGTASVTATANTVAGAYSVAATVGALAPASFALTNTAGAAATVTVTGGGTQSAVVGAAFGAPLAVVVKDAHGNPVPGATVTFTGPASGAGAVCAPAAPVTDASGAASCTATANTVAGAYTVTAAAPGASSGTFALTNLAGAPASIEAAGGGGQQAIVLEAFAAPLAVVVKDAHGNPAPEATVALSAPSSGASATFASATIVTDADGAASVVVTANAVAGAYVATAAAGEASVTFALTNLPAAAATIAVSSGSGQSAVVDTAFAAALVAVVRDAHGNAVPGHTVELSAPVSGATAALSAASAATGADGTASVTATASETAGGYAVTASGGAIGSATFALVNVADVPAGLAVSLGASPQATTVNEAFAQPLAVHVVDRFGNPAPGAVVTYAAPTTAATASLYSTTATTDAYGNASVTATASATAGAYAVSASVGGVETMVAFALTNLAGAPATIAATGGDGQSAVVDTDFDEPLQVLVLDGSSNPVPNAAVSIVVPASGATAVPAATVVSTGLDGVATVAVRAGLVTGDYQVAATVPGAAAPATFELSNLPGAAVAITAAPTSTPQRARVTTAFVAPLAAQVTDAHGNGVPDTVVTYAVPATGATAALSAVTVTTNGDGWVQVDATAGSATGEYGVTASIAAGSISTTFSLENTAGTPTTLTAAGGGGQSAVVDTLFGAPLAVQVRDEHGNAVPGAEVTFAAPGSGATASFPEPAVLTDANGVATAAVRAGTVVGSYEAIATAGDGAAPLAFELANTPDVPAAIAAVAASTPQTAEVGTAFAQPLAVTVEDRFGNRVPGATVRFKAPLLGATAALSASTNDTDGEGRTSVLAVAGTKAGTYQVTATVGTVTAAAVITLTNTAGAPSRAVVMGGGGQRTLATTAFAQPVVVRVVDATGNAVAGAVVRVAPPPSTEASALVTTAPLPSDEDGMARFSLRANDVVGDYLVAVTVDGGMSAVQVALRNDEIPTAITVTSAGDVSVDAPVAARVVVTAQLGTPMGSVEIVDETGAVLATGVLDAAGGADVAVTLRGLGVHALKARYAAQGPFGASESAAVTVEAFEDEGSLSGGSSSCAAGGGGGGGASASLAVLLVAAVVMVVRRRGRGGGGRGRGRGRGGRGRGRGGRGLARSASSAIVAAMVAAVALLAPSLASAQPAGSRAIGRMHTASSDSDWIEGDSVSFAGRRTVTLGFVTDYAYRPLVAYDANGMERGVIVRHALIAHAGLSVTLRDRFRLSSTVPMAMYQGGGDGIVFNGMTMPEPTFAFGDVSISADVRFLGTSRGRLRAAGGLRVSLPTGSRTNYMSNGVAAFEPRLLLASTLGRLEAAVGLSAFLREQTSLAGLSFGHELRYSASLGARFLSSRLLIGPELLGATPLTSNTETGAPTELNLGAHLTLTPRLQLGAGAGLGLNNAPGSPDQRAILSLRWLP